MCPLSSATGTSLVSSSSDCLLWGCTLPLRLWEKGWPGLQSHQQWVAPRCPFGMAQRVLSLPAALQCLSLVQASPCPPPWACALRGRPAGRGSPAELRQHRQQGVMHPGIFSLASTYSVLSNSHFDPIILSGQACVSGCSAEPSQPFSCRGRFLVTPPQGGCGLQPVSEGIS